MKSNYLDRLEGAVSFNLELLNFLRNHLKVISSGRLDTIYKDISDILFYHWPIIIILVLKVMAHLLAISILQMHSEET